MPPKRKRKKSAKRVARGKKLARALPRDRKGKFLPRGSKNLFRKKKGRKRSKSAPARRRRKQPIKRAKLTRRKSQTMPRRTRGKDDYPNFLSGALTLTQNAFTTVQIFTPIPRLKTIGNKATVMELLWVDMVPTVIDLAAINDSINFQMTIGTTQSALLGWEDTRVIMDFSLEVQGTTSGFTKTIFPWRYDFQTQDGFGYLLASDSFRVSGNSNGMAAASIFAWKMYYRFVDIPLSEFIGIVQSTQAS